MYGESGCLFHAQDTLHSNYPKMRTRDHLCSYEVGTGLYDVEYLEVLFDDNKEAITQIEGSAYKSGFGPLVSCPTAWNNSSVKVHCREQ
jgi:hypothetical protein